MIWPFAILVAIAFLVSLGMTALLRGYAIRRNIVDHPNARSSHATPTPRGGGLAIILAFLIASIAAWLMELIPAGPLIAATIGAVLVATVGFFDDHRHVAAWRRFTIHMIAALAALLLLPALPEITFGELRPLPALFETIIFFFGLVWLVNLYNFMDGIDGIAAVEAITVSASAALIAFWSGDVAASGWLLLIAASACGFLIWNWPPARIFMGDVGSGAVGFLLGTLALYTSATGAIELWSWIILCGVFLTDATWTLVRRFASRHRWYEAHRTHAYQHIARRLGRHLPVTIGVGVINVCWLLPLAWIATRFPEAAGYLTLLAYGPLVLAAALAGAGRPEVPQPASP